MELPARERLAVNLTNTSKAYGYTLCVWGSGAMLIGAYGLPSAWLVMLYVLGAVIGFATLVMSVYGTLFTRVDNIQDTQILAATMIHLIAAPLTILIALGITAVTDPVGGWLLAGVNTTFSYNILMLVEAVFYEELYEFERWAVARVRGR